MTITIEPAEQQRPDFVGIVTGIDLRQTLSSEQLARIESGMDHYGVLVFRNQQLTDDQQLAFTRQLGPIEPAYGVPGDDVQKNRLPPGLNDISNLDRDSKLLAADDRQRLFHLGNMLWHSDSSYKATPAKYSLLSARAIPDHGGNTEFADMRAAWDTLDASTQRLIRKALCEHSRLYSRRDLGFEFTEEEVKKFAPIAHPLVRRHPVTGRLSLYLSAHGGTLVGWLFPEARSLLAEITEHATQRERVHAHVWQQYDLVMWDNRVSVHRARRFPIDQVRDMRRTTVEGVAPTLEEAS